MKNEIIEKEFNEIFSPQEIDTLIKAAELEAKAKFLKESKKEEIIECFKKHGIKSFETDNLTITYLYPGVKRVIDIDALKQEGLYENHLKNLTTNESLRITVKYNG